MSYSRKTIEKKVSSNYTSFYGSQHYVMEKQSEKIHTVQHLTLKTNSLHLKQSTLPWVHFFIGFIFFRLFD